MDDDDSRQNEAMMAARARMYAPLVWDMTPDFAIQSLNDTRYDEAINLIKKIHSADVDDKCRSDIRPLHYTGPQHHYIKEEPMSSSNAMSQDRSSVKRFLEMALTWMKDTISICALSARTGRLVGVVVMRIHALIDKSETYNRIQVLKGDVLPQIMHLRGTLVRQAKIYDNLSIEDYFKVYILAVHPSYERKGVRSALIKAAISVCRALKSRAIFGIFTSKSDQELVESLGWKIFSEIQYSRWIINDQVVFDDPGIGNYSAALMGALVPEEPSEEQQTKQTDASEMGKKRKKGKTPCQQ